MKGNRIFALILFVSAILLLSHTLQIQGWALIFWRMGALPTYETSIYFSVVTYTTLGYGDVTLGEDFRTFGGMAAVTGVLVFGLSVAALVGLISRLFADKDL